jgi:hypothetical protein
MPSVESPGIRPQQPLHPFDEVCLRCFQNKVEMIWDKGIRVISQSVLTQITGAEAADNVPPWAMDRHHLYGDYPSYYTRK